MYMPLAKYPCTPRKRYLLLAKTQTPYLAYRSIPSDSLTFVGTVL